MDEELLLDLYKSLTEELKSLKYEVSELRNEQKLTNSLLKIILSIEYDEYLLPNVNDVESKHCCTIIYKKFDDVLSFIKKIAERKGSQVYIFEGVKEGDMMACLTNASDGDYIIIKGDERLMPIELQETLLEVIQKNEATLHIGKGEWERVVNIQVPKLHYVFFTILEELIPELLKKLFPIVNSKKEIDMAD